MLGLPSLATKHRLISRDRLIKYCVFLKILTNFPFPYCFAALSFFQRELGAFLLITRNAVWLQCIAQTYLLYRVHSPPPGNRRVPWDLASHPGRAGREPRDSRAAPSPRAAPPAAGPPSTRPDSPSAQTHQTRPGRPLRKEHVYSVFSFFLLVA